MDDAPIAKKLLEHDEQFSLLREELVQMRKEALQGQDEIMTILRRLDQERVFTTEWVKRIESEVDRQKLEIDKIKRVLDIA